ncbi:4-hydroxy-tetrahydrodipicolinate synthase [Marinihelvus fidelis]|uniref:4-hydroxy-tetrahydrodipicolinate synthase n=1 Tax=Marinihelvus fidelis TaxID=2613842 RepID=A0A5N0T4K1_9GAMM|nr:4-hydroxy-tetrahydrodipicolinate synthase [Marinihelvus fidelis]KAA9129833.1 4-hydroxy-tetrahydrodipicolinate synthase [Marinihelvus fidelis]
MFHGSIVALVTPMDSSGQVDEDAFLRLLDFQLENGTTGVVIAGTTAEAATLTDEEADRLLELAVRHIDGHVPVIAGTGNQSTTRTIRRTQKAASLGADAALAVTPCYNRPPQRGLEAHYREVARHGGLPLILYNVPTRAAVDLLPATVQRLSGEDNIVALKEAVGDATRVSEQLAACGTTMDLLSGDDGSCRAAMEAGASGVISVATNVVPGPMSRLCAAVADGDLEQARAIDTELQGLYRLLGVETNPIPVKWMLCAMGMIGPGIRLPLMPLDGAYRQDVESCLQTLGLVPGRTL